MLRAINEAFDKKYSRLSLKERYVVNVDLGNRVEHIPFESEWAANYRAREYAKLPKVRKVTVTGKGGNVLSSYPDSDTMESLDNTKVSPSRRMARK